jgi:trans-aconitate methyltransferase
MSLLKQFWKSPRQSLSAADVLNVHGDSVIETVSGADDMYMKDWPYQYFAVGADALRLILLAMIAAGKRNVKSILDLPCGHGRVTRYLKVRFPEAHLTACDMDRDGVDFCVKTFGARGVYSQRDIRSVVIKDKFDLIWVGSLFTHVTSSEWHWFFQMFSDHLEENGLLIFTTHGRYTAKLITDKTHLYELQP